MPAQSSSTQGGAPSRSPQHSTLLSHGSGASSTQASPRHSFCVRIFNPDCKKQYDTLTLRNVNKESVSSPLDLKKYGTSLEVKLYHQTSILLLATWWEILNWASFQLQMWKMYGVLSKREKVSVCGATRWGWGRKGKLMTVRVTDSDDSSDVDTTYHKSKKRKKRKRKK